MLDLKSLAQESSGQESGKKKLSPRELITKIQLKLTSQAQKTLLTLLALALTPIGVLARVLRKLSVRFKVYWLIYLRESIIQALKEPDYIPAEKPRVIVTIAHIVSEATTTSPELAQEKTERLKNTIDGLLNSFAHCKLKLVVSTLPGRSIVHFLPAYQQEILEVLTEPNYEPMQVGYRMQDVSERELGNFDWFVFIEDDIILNDSYMLEKLATFNQLHEDPDTLLLPHRYEIFEGTKRYIDLSIDRNLAWDKLSTVEIQGVKYTHFTNPHSGIFCLSHAQAKHWLETGLPYRKMVFKEMPLESAATMCLFKSFNVYKPHPENLNYFEVRHYDTKYSQLYPCPGSPYVLTPTSANK